MIGSSLVLSMSVSRLLAAGLPVLLGVAVLASAEPAAAAPDECLRPANAFTVLWLDVRESKPGETVEIAPQWSPGPWAFEPVPAGCVDQVTLSDPGLAALSADRRRLTVSPKAPHGARLTVEVKIGAEVVKGVVLVVDPAAVPLAGLWRQTATDCPGQAFTPNVPIREFELKADGRFAVTWQPFETYRDYWGTWRHDAATGAFDLVVDKGNRVPPDLDLSGRARITADGALELTGLALGQPDGATAPAACTLRFSR
jgi:hypothetical protein